MDCTCITEAKTIVDVDANIEKFRKKFNASVKSLPDILLLWIKNALLFIKLQTAASLFVEVSRNWIEITSGNYCFNRREQEIAAINAIGADDIKKWLAHVSTDASKLRKLSIQVCNGEQVAPGCNVKQHKTDLDPGSKNNRKYWHLCTVYLFVL